MLAYVWRITKKSDGAFLWQQPLGKPRQVLVLVQVLIYPGACRGRAIDLMHFLLRVTVLASSQSSARLPAPLGLIKCMDWDTRPSEIMLYIGFVCISGCKCTFPKDGYPMAGLSIRMLRSENLSKPSVYCQGESQMQLWGFESHHVQKNETVCTNHRN